MEFNKELKIIFYLKAIIALILILSIFLPFSSCRKITVEHYEYGSPPKLIDNEIKNQMKKLEPLELETNKSKMSHHEGKYLRYVLRDFDFNNYEDYILVLCFIWAIPILILSKITLKAFLKNIFYFAEPIFAILAAYWIYYSADLGPEIGAVLSFFANAFLLIIWFIESSMKFIHYRLKMI